MSTSPRPQETRALVDALGDFLLFLQREKQLRRATRRRAKPGELTADDVARRDRKRSVLAWLRALSESEWTSLCTVVDAGFVKTVLAMGMAARTTEAARARSRRACSVSSATRGVAEFQLAPRDDVAARRALDTTQPREFLRRPVTRARDGDTLAGFQSQAFIDACEMIEGVTYVLNTTRSCDTVNVITTGESTRSEWLSRMDVISGGEFLLNYPSDQDLQQPLWGQTRWFTSRGHTALAELIVNQIEIAIWSHWSQLQKSHSYRIPIQGIAAKKLLAEEWRVCREAQKKEALECIAIQVMGHLKQLATPTTKALTRTTQLSTLIEILESLQSLSSSANHSTSSTTILFAQPLRRILTSPQTAAVSFLVAELLQGECAKIVTENLINPTPVESGEHAKSTHAQRRRTARKKIAKQRKQDNEYRVAHERLLRAVCAEIPRVVKEWNARSFETVREVLDNVIDAVAAAFESERNYFAEDGVEASAATVRSKRKKKRGKKKSSRFKNTIDGWEQDQADNDRGLFVGGKENLLPNKSALPQSTIGGAAQVKELRNDLEQSMILRPENSRPLLSLLASSEDQSYTTTRTSTFGSHPFYNLTSPLYFQLTSNRDISGTVKPEAEEAMDGGAGTTAIQGDSSTIEPNFDWYLPSLFSSQSSAHTSSTVSSLDWDFQRWNSKTDNQARTHATVKSNKLRPLLKTSADASPPAHPARPPAVGEDGSSTDSFAMNAFTSIIDVSDEESVKSDGFDEEAIVVPEALEEDVNDERSDFLYREGGFFDRQRGSKRRRRPFPFEYDDDIADNSSMDGTTAERSWEGRLSNASDRGRLSVRSDASTNNLVSCICKGKKGADEDTSSRENASLAERISKLEGLLEARSVQNLNSDTSAVAAEMNELREQVAELSKRVESLETELEEVRRAHENARNEDNLPPPPPPPSTPPELQENPLQDQQHPFSATAVTSGQSYPHPIMRPGGASNYSILGPFVSVPMSVLPPRSKLHWDMCEFVSQLQNDSNARLSAQMAAIRFCTSAVQSLWPRAQVRPYGSFVTRLALPTSDVDLVICLPKVRRDAPADAAGVLEGRNAIKESWQQNLARKLRQEAWVVSDSVKTIPHAAIPIISLVTTLPFNIRLDISFEGPGHNGLATNDVVLSLMHEFPPLAPIMLVLKSFVIERGFAVAYSGGLSSYALLLMVARYLQEHTDRYDSTASSSTASSSSADFGMVLMGLLDFYGNRFEPRTTGISVAARCFFNRDSIVPSHQHIYAPASVMHSVDDAQDHWQQMNHSHLHSANLLSSPGSRRHNNRTALNDWPSQRTNGMPDSSLAAHDPHKFDPLFIEDPLHPSNNVGRNCFRITQIRRAFAAGYEIIMAASMSTSVFSENRTSLIGGVNLHPENILRAILGPSSPAFTAQSKTENGSVNVPPAFQPPKSRDTRRPAVNGARYAPVIMPLYDQQHAAPTFISGAPYYNGPAAPPPYTIQHVHHQHHPQHHPHTQHQSAAGKSQPRSAESAASHRRHSESVTEHMTTRSEAASTAATYFAKRTTTAERTLACSPRLIPPTMHRSSSIELDKKMNGGMGSIESNGAARGTKTRKSTSRSMSFADVVVSGGGAATVENQRKAPSSPLALMRSSRRTDGGFDEAIVERLETKDDFELK